MKRLHIEPGSPGGNGYNESFNGKLRDGLVNRGIFYTLREARVRVEQRRQIYDKVWPRSALGYCLAAPEAIEIPRLIGKQPPLDRDIGMQLD